MAEVVRQLRRPGGLDVRHDLQEVLELAAHRGVRPVPQDALPHLLPGEGPRPDTLAIGAEVEAGSHGVLVSLDGAGQGGSGFDADAAGDALTPIHQFQESRKPSWSTVGPSSTMRPSSSS